MSRLQVWIRDASRILMIVEVPASVSCVRTRAGAQGFAGKLAETESYPMEPMLELARVDIITP